MLFHPLKCKVMHLGHNNPGKKYVMETGNGGYHTLETVDQEKDLGVTVDTKLTFTKHVNSQVNKANQVLGAVKHTFATLDKTNFLLLYKSLVRPQLEYATVVWNPRFKRDKDALEQVQRRATRLVSGLSHLSYQERLLSLGLPTLEFRRRRADVIQAFKIINGIDKINYSRQCQTCGNSLFKPALSRSTRSHNQKLQIQHQPGVRKYFFTARVSLDWNRLSQDTVDAPSVDSFKYRLSREWENHPERFNYRFSY